VTSPNAWISRDWDGWIFRWCFHLRIDPSAIFPRKDWLLDGTFMGFTRQEAEASLKEINERRQSMGLAALVVHT